MFASFHSRCTAVAASEMHFSLLFSPKKNLPSNRNLFCTCMCLCVYLQVEKGNLCVFLSIVSFNAKIWTKTMQSDAKFSGRRLLPFWKRVRHLVEEKEVESVSRSCQKRGSLRLIVIAHHHVNAGMKLDFLILFVCLGFLLFCCTHLPSLSHARNLAERGTAF